MGGGGANKKEVGKQLQVDPPVERAFHLRVLRKGSDAARTQAPFISLDSPQCGQWPHDHHTMFIYDNGSHQEMSQKHQRIPLPGPFPSHAATGRGLATAEGRIL